METSNWRTDRSLKEILFTQGYRFEFFQAVRILARILPNKKTVGGLARPQDEVVRFSSQLTLDFPPSAVNEIIESADGPAKLIEAFFGLTGTQGVLPHFYTEYLLIRDAAKDHGMADFLDLFNHRLLSFFYRAWEKHRIYITFERAQLTRQPDPFAARLQSLIGMGTAGLRGRLPMRDEALLFYSGLIRQRPHSASALRGILRDYFQVPIEIDQCLGSWYNLRDTERSYLHTDGSANQLGGGAIAGDQVWDQQARFRVCIGPLSFDRFRTFLPGNEALHVLTEWIRFFVGRALAFDVRLILKAEEVPEAKLDDTALDGARLGFVGWMKTEAFQSNVSDVEFTYVS